MALSEGDRTITYSVEVTTFAKDDEQATKVVTEELWRRLNLAFGADKIRVYVESVRPGSDEITDPRHTSHVRVRFDPMTEKAVL